MTNPTNSSPDSATTQTYTHPDLIERALEAFWDVVAKAYPQATSGDLPPEITSRTSAAMASAVDAWIAYNVPQAMQRETAEPQSFQAAWFSVDDLSYAAPGYWRPSEHHNGFAVPYFEKAGAEMLALRMPEVRFNPANNAYDFIPNGDGEPESWTAQEIDVPGRGKVTVWAIGWRSWVWEALDSSDLQSEQMRDLDTPEERLRLIEALGVANYNAVISMWRAACVIETVGGHALRRVNSQFAKLISVGDTGRAFESLEQARAFAAKNPAI